MRLNEQQLGQVERLLESQGFRKCVCRTETEKHDGRCVCTNESWHWYKTIEREWAEDKYGDIYTTYSTVLYIAFWDFREYLKYDSNVVFEDLIAGTQVLVRIISEKYNGGNFEFPWAGEETDNNIFQTPNPAFTFNSDNEESNEPYYIQLTPTDEQVLAFLKKLEELGHECSSFYREKATKYL